MTEQLLAQSRSETWPTVGVSVVIFSLRPSAEGRRELAVLLVRRPNEPCAGLWALPGGWVRNGEGLEESARRHLLTKTGLHPTFLEQLYTFGQPDRDPREHRIAVGYYVLVRTDDDTMLQGEREASWFGVGNLPSPLAFDNDQIVQYALWRLRNKVSYAYVAYQLLPPTFTLAHLLLHLAPQPVEFGFIALGQAVLGTAQREVHLEDGFERPPVGVVLDHGRAQRVLERVPVFDGDVANRLHRIEVLGETHRQASITELDDEPVQQLEHPFGNSMTTGVLANGVRHLASRLLFDREFFRSLGDV